ncbi:hypothetical protein CRG98_001142 [Punica granatum]|uniref:Uncharacterized protein n=1 Tax=Punica granatum TaxID=22663 RepID=A0A2I0LCV2_PUNGR|nr:hypothetical protein CRG98_001142 [Punica granatum]
MNYKEETGATKGRKRGDQRKQTSNEPQSSRNWHCSTIYRRITGAPKDAFLTGPPGCSIHEQINSPRKQAYTHPRITRTRE